MKFMAYKCENTFRYLPRGFFARKMKFDNFGYAELNWGYWVISVMWKVK